MRRNIKKVMAEILPICLIVASTSVNSFVYAKDETGQTSQQEEASEDFVKSENNEETENSEIENRSIEDTDAASTESESKDIEKASSEDTESQEENEVQQELKENSWRYQEGELIKDPKIRAKSAISANAWQKVDGVYLNSAGEAIAGAISKGIDISEHQGTINWSEVQTDGIDFAIIRCGFGDDDSSQDDKYWKYNVSECERLGIPYGVYLYSYATTITQAKSEAAHVLRLLKGHSPAYPVYFDMEDERIEPLNAAMKGQLAKTFCDTVSAAGYRVGIYANLNWWNNYLTDPVFNNSSWSKWVAQYNTICNYDGYYDFWQCTNEGNIAGINENVDLNFLMKRDTDSGYSEGTTLAVRRGNVYYFKYSLSNGAADVVVPYGYSSDEVLVGDWDGDGVDTLCVRRGNKYYFKNSLSGGAADKTVIYGKPGDKVFVGDWDGDGIDTLCVQRGSTYYIKNSFTAGEADLVVVYGKSGDSVLVGDWNGDGVDTICVRRDNIYYFKNNLSNGTADNVIVYGQSSDAVLVGDWDDDGIDTLCVRRRNVYHIKNCIQSGAADKVVVYGKSSDVTYAGKWK